MTHNLATVQDLPVEIDHPGEVEVRGEVYMSSVDFERMNREPPDPGSHEPDNTALCGIEPHGRHLSAGEQRDVVQRPDTGPHGLLDEGASPRKPGEAVRIPWTETARLVPHHVSRLATESKRPTVDQLGGDPGEPALDAGESRRKQEMDMVALGDSGTRVGVTEVDVVPLEDGHLFEVIGQDPRYQHACQGAADHRCMPPERGQPFGAAGTAHVVISARCVPARYPAAESRADRAARPGIGGNPDGRPSGFVVRW